MEQRRTANDGAERLDLLAHLMLDECADAMYAPCARGEHAECIGYIDDDEPVCECDCHAVR